MTEYLQRNFANGRTTVCYYRYTNIMDTLIHKGKRKQGPGCEGVDFGEN